MTTDSAIRRMLRPASGPSPAAAAGIGRIWGNAIARVAEDQLGLPVECGIATIAAATVPLFLSDIPAHAMLLRLDGPAGAQGLALAEADAVAALVEMHTLRRLRSAVPDPRPPTRTDAAIVAPILDAALAVLTERAAGGLVPKWAAGWRIAAFAPDPRPLGLTMADVPCRRMTLPMTFGLDRARRSQLSLLMPDSGWAGGGGGAGQGAPSAPAGNAREDWQDRLGRAAMPAETEVRGVLWRITLPLAGVAALKAGDSLPIPEQAIDGVRVETPEGRCLAVGRLGQLRGDRAVRLRELAGPDGEIGQAEDAAGIALTHMQAGGDAGFASDGIGGAGGFGGSAGTAGGDAFPGGFLAASPPAMDGLPDLPGGGLPDLAPSGLPMAGDPAPAFAFAPIDDLPDRID